MKSKLADGFVLAIFFGIIWGVVVLCTCDVSIKDTEGRCNTRAVDDLNGGRSPEDVIAEHAKCLRGVKP
jgi:hypothetical protein